MTLMRLAMLLVAGFVLLGPTVQAQVTLVQTSDAGFYNDDLGTILNLSNGQPDDANQPFPVSNDSSASFLTQPDISAADAILGDWLTNPLNLNSHWSATPISVPNNWTVSTEVAVIYQFDTLAATNVVARFGVDNGIYAWLDGQYIFGARGPGGVSLGEYTLNLGDFAAGTHFLQLLLEDHGSVNGYAVEIKADTFIPGPPPNSVPVPAALPAGLALMGMLGVRRGRRGKRG